MKKIILLTCVFGFAAALSASAADGKALWESSHCAMCHGADGKGDTKIGGKLGVKDFTDAKVQADMKDEAMVKAIKEGITNDDGKTLMKPADSLSDADVKTLVEYIRSLKK